jgi:glucose-6-phosphate isomerase
MAGEAEINDDAVAAALTRLSNAEVGRRLWQKDASLWSDDPQVQGAIRNRLGWLNVIADMRRSGLDEIDAFAKGVRADDFTDAVVLGMGGSSLCPDVCRATFGTAPGWLNLHVLDSTHPRAVRAVRDNVDVARTLFLVSSKSGTTGESNAFYHYFWEQVAQAGVATPGANFVAITDPGTSLDEEATARGFRHVFRNPADIGGRYSALSFFGLVPMALLGMDVGDFLQRASAMARRCGPDVAAADNPALVLGAQIASHAQQGRDKLTLVCAPEIATLGWWLEQLVAESLGKQGVGVVPIEGEELGGPDECGRDRVFVHLALPSEQEESQSARLQALQAAGHPVIRLEMAERMDMGQEFFRWEFATAVAGWLMGVNPFDEPNVQESKDNTGAVLEMYEREGALPVDSPCATEGPLSVFGDCDGSTVGQALQDFLGNVHLGDYLALMAYLPQGDAIDACLASIRHALRVATGTATTVGYGPRFLHSTGQLHKGGPNTAVCLQLTADFSGDESIPDSPYSFGTFVQAQAIGDLRSLQEHERRVMRIHLGADWEQGLAALEHALKDF